MRTKTARISRFWRALFCLGLVVPLLLLSGSADFVEAGVTDNTTGAFADGGVGARAIGMGGAFVAVADDVYAMEYNPAGLALLDRASVTFDYANLYDLGLLKQSYLGGAFPTRWGVHGLSYKGLRVAFDPFPQKLNETTLGYGYGRSFGPFSLGTRLKYFDLSSDFTNGTATGIGFDIGARYQVTDRWSLGASIQNLYSNLNFGTGTSESIPTSWKLGTAYRINEKWILAFDYDGVSGDAFNRLRLGTEYWIIRPSYRLPEEKKHREIFAGVDLEKYPISLAIRSGFDKSQSGKADFTPTVGATFGYGAVRLDYAFEFNRADLGSTHRYSLSYDFKPWGEKPMERVDRAEYAAKKRKEAPAVPPPPPPSVAERRSSGVAIVDFANATGNEDLSWLEIGFADIVADELSKRGIPVVPRSALANSASLPGPEILKRARNLNAGMVVRGLYVYDPSGKMVLTVRLIDVSTGKTVDFIEASGGASDIFTVGRAIGAEVASRIGNLSR